MWQHKDVHDLYKRSKLTESDFVSRAGTSARSAHTLNRPVGSQAPGRYDHQRTPSATRLHGEGKKK